MEPESAVDESGMPPIADCHRQVQRVLQSVTFRNASTLQQLLQFLTARALDGQSEQLKEYTIGVEAFGRSQDFDPKIDTIVRVQTHRLRQKLKEYYDNEGKRDPVLIEIPKGHYLPRFESSPEPGEPLHHAHEANGGSTIDTEARAHFDAFDLHDKENLSQKQSRKRFFKTAVLVGFALVLVFAIGVAVGIRRGAQPIQQSHAATIHELAIGGDPVKAFWASFVGDDPNPVIAYPDAVFLLDNSNDLFRYRQGASDDRGSLVDPHLAQEFASNPKLVAQAGALYFENGYTGVGELQAVGMLSGLFGQMGIHPILKPSRDITPVDLRQHSVILLGSSFQNVAVAQLMMPGDFRFNNPDSRLEQWRAEIQNKKPQQGESSIYRTIRDPQTRILKQDYSIFSVQAGVVPGRHIAVLGGLDTTGTEGVTMFATSRSGVDALIKQLTMVRQQGTALTIPQFQALVRVSLEKGYEVLGSSLEAVHKFDATNGQSTDGAAATP
ncbi:MAG TPA: hypothetical protein VG844_01885 [Terracidiphilus sp.]|nr:hypothetical protein [Terracidiphilus sp.]